jgi:hypothetical protein
VARRVIGGRIVGRPELCQTFGITKYEAEKWVQAGCPVVERPSSPGGGWRFDTADVADWRAQQARKEAGGGVKLDLNAERARLAKEQADAQELKNRQTRGELVPADEVEGVWQAAAGRCRAILLLGRVGKAQPIERGRGDVLLFGLEIEEHAQLGQNLPIGLHVASWIIDAAQADHCLVSVHDCMPLPACKCEGGTAPRERL